MKKKIKSRTSQAIKCTGITITPRGVGEDPQGSSHSRGSGAQESYSDRNCFLFSRQMLGALSEEGFLNLIRKWKANGISTHPSFRNNTDLRNSVMSNWTPQGLPLLTETPGQGTSLLHVTMKKRHSKLDAIYHLHSHQCGCWLKTGGQDQGAGTHVSYIQSVLLHSTVLKDSNSTAWTVPKHEYIQNLATKGSLTWIK